MKIRRHRVITWVSVFYAAFLGHPSALAIDYNGRITTGGYLAKEHLRESLDGSQENDFATISSRFYLGVSKLDGRYLETIADVRDKHDFFDKLDRERLTLNSQNRLQARQLSLKYPNPSGFFGTLGRFPLLDAGAVFADGAHAGYTLTPAWSVAAFGGLNPKRGDQTYLEFNKDSYVFGGYFLYEPPARSWTRYTYLTNAFVTQKVRTETDRSYWYHNLVFQPSASVRIITLGYLDFVPRLHLQNLQASYYQEYRRDLSSVLRLSSIDVIEYARIRGVRERLTPSAYKEGSLRGTLRTGKTVSWQATGIYGLRQVDEKNRIEGNLGILLNEWVGRRINTTGLLGYRRNFTSNDAFARLVLGYYPEKWEFMLSAESGIEKYDSGTTLYPVVGEASFARYISQSVYATFSAQEALDSNASIFSAFLKINYRFGSKKIPPVRDGAPPLRGEL